jgi:hypothetical protein
LVALLVRQSLLFDKLGMSLFTRKVLMREASCV